MVNNERLYAIAKEKWPCSNMSCHSILHSVVDAVADAVRAEQHSECAHSWHDYGKVNQSWCHKCNAIAVTGYEDRPFAALAQQEPKT